MALKAPLELKEEVRGWTDLQIVAFPQEGILSYPKGAELLEESLRLGADVVRGHTPLRVHPVDGVTACFDMVTEKAARTSGLKEYRITTESPADLVLVDTADKREAIRLLAAPTLVVKDGQVISETRPAETQFMGQTVNFGREKVSENGRTPESVDYETPPG